MEEWNNGIMGRKMNDTNPIFQHSSIPIFHHSIIPYFLITNYECPSLALVLLLAEAVLGNCRQTGIFGPDSAS